MKILMVTHYFGSHQSGIEIVAERIFRGLERECEVVWAAADVTPAPIPAAFGRTLPLATSNRIENLTGIPCPVPTPAAVRALRMEVASADVVLLHDCLYLSNIAAFRNARRRGVPVIIVQHIGEVPYKNPVLRLLMKLANRAVARRMLASAQQVVFISEVTRHYFDTVQFRRTPVLIFNGVDTGIYRPVPSPQKPALRERLGLPADRPVSLFVGRFVEKKGLEVLRHMAAMGPEVTWAFAGWGRLDPRNWKAANVHVYSGLQGASLAELYQASDIFVLPSTGEGFPLVVQEAMACGLPVVCGADTATADPALGSLVRGVAVTPGDDRSSASAFLTAVREVLIRSTQPDEAQRRHEFAHQRYSWQRTVEQYLRIAAELAGTNAAKARAMRCPSSAPVAHEERP